MKTDVKIRFPRIVGKLLLAVVTSSPLLGDELPPGLRAKGKPETSLAGIDISKASIADVVRKIGKPDKVIRESRLSGAATEATEYYWERSGVRLLVKAYGENGKGSREYLAVIEAEGPGFPGGLGRTGAGLKLGDRLSDLRHIYGRRFEERVLQNRKIHDVAIMWRHSESSLAVKLDASGRIIAISLYAPE